MGLINFYLINKKVLNENNVSNIFISKKYYECNCI